MRAGRAPAGRGLDQVLPVANHVHGLATFENLRNAISNADGVETLARALDNYVLLYPNHARPLRLALVNRDPDDALLASLLACSPELVARLDPRVLLGLRRRGAPAHILTRFIVVELLGRAGPLVDSDLLAVRLGVDATRSEDWPELLASLEASRYRGAFAAGYARWWMASLLNWWRSDVEPDSSPQRLGASERVQLLGRTTVLRRGTGCARPRRSTTASEHRRWRGSGDRIPIDHGCIGGR